MTSRDFCFWLQGYLEIASEAGPVALSAKQVETVKKHLALVFIHEIEPSMPGKKLDDTHSPFPPSEPGGPVYRC